MTHNDFKKPKFDVNVMARLTCVVLNASLQMCYQLVCCSSSLMHES